MSPATRWKKQHLGVVLGPEMARNSPPRPTEMHKARLQTGFICFLLVAVRSCIAQFHQLWEACKEPLFALLWPGVSLCASSFPRGDSL